MIDTFSLWSKYCYFIDVATTIDCESNTDLYYSPTAVGRHHNIRTGHSLYRPSYCRVIAPYISYRNKVLLKIKCTNSYGACLRALPVCGLKAEIFPKNGKMSEKKAISGVGQKNARLRTVAETRCDTLSAYRIINARNKFRQIRVLLLRNPCVSRLHAPPKGKKSGSQNMLLTRCRSKRRIDFSE